MKAIRLLRYRLRSLLAAMTIVAVLLAWQVNLMRERRATLDWIHHSGDSSGREISYTVCWPVLPPTEALAFRCKYAWNASKQYLQRLLGGRQITYILLPDDLPLTDAELDRIKSLFSEATVQRRSKRVARHEKPHLYPWVSAPELSQKRDEK